MSRVKSAFASWFRSQFGRDTMSDDEYSALWKEVRDLRVILAAKERDLREEDLLREKHTAALYAWNVSDAAKTGRDWE
jgi:hypothetical protein